MYKMIGLLSSQSQKTRNQSKLTPLPSDSISSCSYLNFTPLIYLKSAPSSIQYLVSELHHFSLELPTSSSFHSRLLPMNLPRDYSKVLVQPSLSALSVDGFITPNKYQTFQRGVLKPESTSGSPEGLVNKMSLPGSYLIVSAAVVLNVP